MGYLTPKLSLYNKRTGIIYPEAGKDKRSYTDVKAISQKVNLIAQIEFILAYHTVTVQHISNYTTGTFTQFGGVFVLQILQNKSVIIVHEIQKEVASHTKALIGQKMQKYEFRF